MRDFDLQTGEREKSIGLDRVSVGAEEFIDMMRETAIEICKRQGSVSSDDLRRVADMAGIEPHHPNAWGAIFRGKHWECVARKRSELVSNHAREIRVWEYV